MSRMNSEEVSCPRCGEEFDGGGGGSCVCPSCDFHFFPASSAGDESVLLIDELLDKQTEKVEEERDEAREPLPPKVDVKDTRRGKLSTAFLFPFGGKGRFVVFGVPVVFWLLEVIALAIGYFGVIFAIMTYFVKVGLVLYVCWYFVESVDHSADGEVEAPNESPADVFEVFGRTFQLIVTAGICWFGVIYYCFKVFGIALPFFFVIGTFPLNFWGIVIDAYPQANIWRLIGAAVFPLAILGVARFEGLGGLNPWLFFKAVVRAPFSYLFLLIILIPLWAIVPFRLHGLMYKGLLGGLPQVMTVLCLDFFKNYLVVFSAYMIGRFYYVSRAQIGWDDFD